MPGEVRLWRRRAFISAVGVLAICAIALGGSGCGTSSRSSSSAVSSTAASTTGSSSAPHPLTKAQYEQRLGPLLNDVVDPALHVALSSGGAPLRQKLTAALTDVRLAHDQMAAVTPPVEVADLHKKAVAILSAMIRDLTKLRGAEGRGDKRAAASAAVALISAGREMESVGSQFVARGY